MRNNAGRGSGVTYIGPRTFVISFCVLCGLFVALSFALDYLTAGSDGVALDAATQSEPARVNKGTASLGATAQTASPRATPQTASLPNPSPRIRTASGADRVPLRAGRQLRAPRSGEPTKVAAKPAAARRSGGTVRRPVAGRAIVGTTTRELPHATRMFRSVAALAMGSNDAYRSRLLVPFASPRAAQGTLLIVPSQAPPPPPARIF